MQKTAAIVILALFALLASKAFGQAVYGNILGDLMDPAGAAVPKARVTITDSQRSVSITTTTNDDGNFTQRVLIAGTYQVRVEASGFKAAVQTVIVSVDQEVRADL